MPWQDQAIPEEQPGLMQKAGRQLGLGVRMTLEGPMDFLALGADPLAVVANKGLEATGSKFRFPENHSAAFSSLLTKAGLPEPKGTMEKVGNFVGRMASGGMASAPLEAAVASRYATPLQGAYSKQDELRMAAETAYDRARQSQIVINQLRRSWRRCFPVPSKRWSAGAPG